MMETMGPHLPSAGPSFLMPTLLLASIALSWNSFLLMFEPVNAGHGFRLVIVNFAASIAVSASGLLFANCGVWLGSGLFVTALGLANSLRRYRERGSHVSVSAIFFCLYLIGAN